MRLRLLLSTLILTGLTGCASLINTDSNEHALSQLERWDITGKISIRSPNEAATGYLSWNQNGSRYELFISGPLGQGSTSIKGNDQQTQLLLPGWQHPQTAENPETLMQQHLGWHFPIQDIFYWIKGQPAPGTEFTLKQDDYGMTESLTQHGWRIEYSRYQQHQTYWLPGRVSIKGHDHRFILSINKWTVYD